MVILGYRFKPKLWTLAITIVFIIIFIELGKWQLSRADEKNERQDRLEQYAKEPAITLPSTLVKLEDYLYREVEITGKFLNEKTILLDNKVHQGRTGYHVLTPLAASNSSVVTIINRGWVAADYDRSHLPEIERQEGEIIIRGVVVSPEIRMLQLTDQINQGEVWNHFDIEVYQQQTGLNLQPIMILQKNQIEDGLVRNWDKPDSGAAKNLGYAFQWFALALTTVIIFFILNVKREGKKS